MSTPPRTTFWAVSVALAFASFAPSTDARAQSDDVEVLFWISSYGLTSYSAHILIANGSTADINAWKLTFELDAPISFVNYALWKQDGTHVEIEGTGWTEVIAAGDSVWFNLTVQWENEIHLPRNVTFNHVPVTLVTTFDEPEDDDDDDEEGGGDGDDDDDDDDIPSPSGGVEVTFWYSSIWDNGFVGWFSFKNMGPTPVNGWSLTFNYPHRITLIWNGVLNVNGRRYTVLDSGWNRSIAPGDSAWFGFQGEYSGTLRDPSGCLFNGEECTMNGVLNHESQLNTGIEDLESAGYTLDVFPNPDPHTVRFSVAHHQTIRLELVDMTGRVVDRFYDGSLSPGRVESVAFKRNDLASGIYVVRLSGTAGTQAQRSIVLIR